MLKNSNTSKTELASALLERVCRFNQNADPVCGNGHNNVALARELISKALQETQEAIQAKNIPDFRNQYADLMMLHLKECFTCNPALLEKVGA